MSKSPQSGDRIPVVQVSSPVARSNPKTRLSISRADLDWAKGEGLIRDDQVDRLWQALSARQAGNQRFDMAHLFWYAGAGLVILAMTVFMGLIATSAGALLATALVYMAGFAGSGYFLSNHRGLRTPGGLLTTLAVVTTPVAVLAAMQLTGNVSMSLGNQLFVEIATIVAGLVALQVVRFPFITAPIYAALWLMSLTLMDSSLINSGWGSNQPLYVTMVFGAAICALSFVIDRRTAEDYSFWGYFFGLISLWGAWTFLDKGGEMGDFFYMVSSVFLMLISVAIQRRIFLVVGAAGTVGYLIHLSWDLFQNSLAFPFVLTGIGLLVIYLGVTYHKHRASIDSRVLAMLPGSFARRFNDDR
ncbi:MAG: DUF2157 domain-containing protein [Cyanobacteria bacterium HKST-UBA02]|nr:DUF2157 domain-containing protein [Cyanobacteria bacterium HKST-UBA02]